MDPFDLVGDVLDGQFRVEEFIGEGALSVVYRAHNEGLDAAACVKCLNLPSTLDPSFAQSIVASFQEGCKLHFRLARGHLAIAQTFANGTTVAPRTGVPVQYVVREWFEGESLARDLRRRRAEGEQGRSLAETIVLFDPIASALTYAQTQGASHLSLMPSNMFLAVDDDGETSLKLLDFGVGRAVDEAASTRSGKVVAEPRMKLLLPTYAAPEQLLSTLGPVGSWTDVYALALVLLEVLSNRPVMSEKDPSALVARALSTRERPTPLAQGVLLPPAIDRALVRALSLEPESRQMSVADLWEEITDAARPGRSERRRLVTHLRRLRRVRKSLAPPKLDSGPTADDTAQTSVFPNEEPPTTKARGVVAMLTARTMRSSTRPPPPQVKASPSVKRPLAPSKKPPPPRPVAPKPPPAPKAASVPEPANIEPEVIRPPLLLPKPLPEIVLGPVEPSPPPPFVAPPVPQALPALHEPSGRFETHEISVREPAVLPSPFALPRRAGLRVDLPDRRVLIAAGVGSAMLLSGVILLVALVRRGHASSNTHAGARASASAVVVVPTATIPPPPQPPTQTTDTSSAVVSASTAAPTPPPSGRPGHFNKKRAVAAVAETTTDLSSCRRKGGVWGLGQAGVIFSNDGSVRTVLMGQPFRGPEGDCVKDQIAHAHIDPFVGIIGPIYVRFVIPY